MTKKRLTIKISPCENSISGHRKSVRTCDVKTSELNSAFRISQVPEDLRSQKNHGTTLLETLLYLGIVVIVAGVAITTLMTVLRVENQSTASRDVSEQGRFIIERIKREVRDASLIDISTTATSSKLVLRMKDKNRDYVSIYASGTTMYMDDGNAYSTSNPTSTNPLTTDKVVLEPDSLVFKRIFNPPAKDALQVDFTLSYASSGKPQLAYSKPFSTTISRVTAAVFDSDLLPLTTPAFDVGSTTALARWKNARFSGKVGIGVDNNREGEIDPASDRLVLGPQIGSLVEGGQLKLLGTSTGKYTILDNYANSLRIMTNSGDGVERPRLFVTDTGRVLIGTSTTNAPGERLEVVGNIISKGTEWAPHTSAAEKSWYAITYGNGLFVAVAPWNVGYTTNCNTNNCVMTSPDGINWTLRDTPPAIDGPRSITYGNGLFVALAGSSGGVNSVKTSPDGIAWTTRVTPGTGGSGWGSVTYGNGLFVAVNGGIYGNIGAMTSSDGINWTGREALRGAVPSNNNGWRGLVYGNGLFVATGNSGSYPDSRAITSPDGINWTSRTTPASDHNWASLAYGNGIFVTTGDGPSGNTSQIMTSYNGIDWTLRDAPTIIGRWHSVTYGNGLFVAVNDGATASTNRVMTSPDGINWTLRNTPDTLWTGVTYGNGTFVAVGLTGLGNRVMTSGKSDYIPFSHNNIYQGGMKIMGGTVAVGTTTQTALFHVATSSKTALYISSSTGNIGIGTNNPTNTNALTIDGAGGIRIRQPSATRYRSDYLVSNASTSIISYDDTGPSFIPLNLYGSSFRFGSTTEMGSVDSSGNWYLGGTQTTGLRINGSNKTDTIYQPSGNLGITVNSGNVVLSGGIGSNVGIGPAVIPSGLGTSWQTPATSPGDRTWQTITYGKLSDGSHRFVALAERSSPRAMYSSDGVNFTFSNIGLVAWNSVTYGTPGGTPRFVAVGNSYVTSYSSDGSTWLNSDTAADQNWTSVAYGTPGGSPRFVAVSRTSISSGWSRFMYSADGITWSQASTTKPSNNDNTWTSVTWSEEEELFVAVANNLTLSNTAYSYDGLNWEAVSSPSTFSWESITYGNGLFVAVATYTSNPGLDKLVMTTPNPATTLWTLQTGGSSNNWNSVTFGKDSNGNPQFIAVARSGTNLAMKSPNGIDWVLLGSSNGVTSKTWQSVTYADYMYVAVGQNGISPLIMYSGELTSDINNPAQKLTVLGNIRIGTSDSNSCVKNYSGTNIVGSCSSDIALKKNLIPLSGSLEKIVELKPMYYNWRADEYPALQLNGNVRNLGLIAQDVEKIFPELVGVDERGLKTVNYGVDLTMHLIGALKELKAKNTSLKSRLQLLENPPIYRSPTSID